VVVAVVLVVALVVEVADVDDVTVDDAGVGAGVAESFEHAVTLTSNPNTTTLVAAQRRLVMGEM